MFWLFNCLNLLAWLINLFGRGHMTWGDSGVVTDVTSKITQATGPPQSGAGLGVGMLRGGGDLSLDFFWM